MSSSWTLKVDTIRQKQSEEFVQERSIFIAETSCLNICKTIVVYKSWLGILKIIKNPISSDGSPVLAARVQLQQLLAVEDKSTS